jgi:hypothetical protein
MSFWRDTTVVFRRQTSQVFQSQAAVVAWCAQAVLSS